MRTLVALVIRIIWYMLYTVVSVEIQLHRSFFNYRNFIKEGLKFSGILRISPVGIVPGKTLYMVLLYMCRSCFTVSFRFQFIIPG